MKDPSQHNSNPTIRNVAILAFPINDPEKSQFIGLRRLAAVLATSAKEVFLITGNFPQSFAHNDVRLINVPAWILKGQRRPLLTGALQVLVAQFTLSGALLRLIPKLKRNAGSVIVFDPVTILLPTLIARLLGMKVLSVLRGYAEEAWQVRKDAFRRPLAWVKKVNLALSHGVIIYHQNLVREWNLERYQNKVLVAPYLFVDPNKFRPAKPLVERANLVGYIGRLGREKGILNFIQAMPELLKPRNDIMALIVGDGQLRDEAEQYTRSQNLSNKVEFSGWIANDYIPNYLNKLKLLILPSHTEGLPNTVLEAMACGTPVLATPVGATSDVIKDEKTGFIMEDNSPECIARNVIRALNHPKLEEIARNARALVVKEFTYQAAVERYRDILASLNLKQ